MSEIKSVNVDQVPAEAVLVDVRENDEWTAGHIEGAHHIPLMELAERAGEIPGEADVYVVCRSGGRSSKATEWLSGNGYPAINVDGGMKAWEQAGYPMATDLEEPKVI